MALEILLARNWFDPKGQRRRAADNPHTVPDSWEKLLPSGTEFQRVEDYEPPVYETAGETLADHDIGRANAEALKKAMDASEGDGLDTEDEPETEDDPVAAAIAEAEAEAEEKPKRKTPTRRRKTAAK